MNRVEIFRTEIKKRSEASGILKVLSASFPHCSFNFDLDDRDRILRVEFNSDEDPQTVVTKMAQMGYKADLIE